MTKDDLIRDAITDAKALQSTALANAKLALTEAFTPKLKAMLSKTIQNEMEDEEDMDYGDDEIAEDDIEVAVEPEEGEDEDEEDLEVEADEFETDEYETDDEEEVEEADEFETDEVPEEDEDEENLEVEADEFETDDEYESDMEDDEDEDEYAEDEDDLDLEAIIAELENELDEADGVTDYGEGNTVVDDLNDGDTGISENDVSSDIGMADNKLNQESGDSSKTGAQGPEGEGKDEPAGKELDDHEIVDDLVEGEEDIDIDLTELLGLDEEDDEEYDNAPSPYSEIDRLKEKLKARDAKLKEYIKTVKYMRTKLNETTLLTNKLLFTNRIFRSFDLDNASKMKVVETFDRAGNPREVKLVYTTLVESMKNRVTRKVSASKSARLAETRKKGSASKPAGSTKPRKKPETTVLTEEQEMRKRMMELANINKNILNG